MAENDEVIIYTDGACSGNPGPGGWAAVILVNDKQIELSGGEYKTTNQRMEMTAPLEALQAITTPSRVKVFTDSAYLVNAFKQDWIAKWMKNGWKTVKGEAVKNKDLWEKLWEMSEYHQVTWHKVKGHSDDELNNRCDYLARHAIPQSEDSDILPGK